MLIRNWDVEGVPGTKGRPARSTIECLSDGRIRQVVEISKDKGRTWSMLFESIYAPATVAARTVAPAPEPSAEPAVATTTGAQDSEPETVEPAQHQAARQATVEGSEVQAVSRELERQEIPAEEAPELVMASPMVLEINPGEVDDYPENTAWSTDETAGFVCNQVIIKKVTAARKSKGDEVHLLVGAQLFTKKRTRTLDLLIEVLLDGEVLASEKLKKVRIGLSIPGHDKTGMMVTARFEMPGGQFDRLFGDGVERKLRLTLTTPSV